MKPNEIEKCLADLFKNVAEGLVDRGLPSEMDKEAEKKNKILDNLHHVFDRMGLDLDEVSKLSYEDQILKMIRLAQKMVYHLEEQRDADGYLWLSFQRDQDRS